MPFILDTDLLTILQEQSQPACDRLLARLRKQPPDDIYVTIISFQERIQGWMTVLNQARSADRLIRAYAKLGALLQSFCKMRIVPFDQAAQDHFVDLRKQRLRIGTMDLRIACIALATGSTLLSRNLQDFRQVPGLIVEDWSS